MSQSQPDIRPSPIAGKWYPGDPTRLAAAVDEFIAQAEVPEFEGELVGILSPHAGHRYSGPVAGYAFRAVQAKKPEVDVVALIGPSHYPYPAPVVSTGHDAYATPLGVVPVDRAALQKLQQRVPIQLVRKDPEHSLEIELPFLQRSLGQFRLIPLAMIDHSVEMAERLGHALAEVLFGQKALIVASSDLSHFYPQQVAHQLDQFVLDAVAAYDPARIIEAEELGKGFACGRAAIAAAMFAARELGADQAQVVHYATSGDVTQDFQQVVGYGAAVFYQSAPPASS
jgi:MEMO1 family protein